MVWHTRPTVLSHCAAAPVSLATKKRGLDAPEPGPGANGRAAPGPSDQDTAVLGSPPKAARGALSTRLGPGALAAAALAGVQSGAATGAGGRDRTAGGAAAAAGGAKGEQGDGAPGAGAPAEADLKSAEFLALQKQMEEMKKALELMTQLTQQQQQQQQQQQKQQQQQEEPQKPPQQQQRPGVQVRGAGLGAAAGAGASGAAMGRQGSASGSGGVILVGGGMSRQGSDFDMDGVVLDPPPPPRQQQQQQAALSRQQQQEAERLELEQLEADMRSVVVEGVHFMATEDVLAAHFRWVWRQFTAARAAVHLDVGPRSTGARVSMPEPCLHLLHWPRTVALAIAAVRCWFGPGLALSTLAANHPHALPVPFPSLPLPSPAAWWAPSRP